MKKKRFAVEQIVSILKQAVLGIPIAGPIREFNSPTETDTKTRSEHGRTSARC